MGLPLSFLWEGPMCIVILLLIIIIILLNN